MSNPVNLPAPPGAAGTPPMFRTLGIAASGLSAHRLRMETVAMNIANADTTRTPGGGAYHRRIVQLQASEPSSFASALNGSDPAGDDEGTGVQVRAIVEDPTAGPRVYEPGHPDADKDGYVTYPNVNVTQEMVELMDARRMFEANATVFQAAKAMLHRSLEI